MTLTDILTSILDLAVIAGLAWCFFHEDALIRLEDRLFSRVRRKRLHLVKKESAALMHSVRQ